MSNLDRLNNKILRCEHMAYIYIILDVSVQDASSDGRTDECSVKVMTRQHRYYMLQVWVMQTNLQKLKACYRLIHNLLICINCNAKFEPNCNFVCSQCLQSMTFQFKLHYKIVESTFQFKLHYKIVESTCKQSGLSIS